ncbi:hypothetical protein ACQEVG_21315 [Streptomyces sp. CA-135486]|uniref:hypothetical protein n=1 Tax=Streptomyces sp. CA-135486 TaxID=3240049 RepID=UPI003D8D47F0
MTSASDNKGTPTTNGTTAGNIGMGISCLGVLLLVIAIWAGSSFGYPGLFTFLAGLFVFGLSPEGRAAQGRRKATEQSLPSGARKLLDLRISGTHASAPGQESISIVGARAAVESSGAIARRATVTRMVAGAALAGPVGAVIAGLGAKKKIDDRHIFVVIENPSGAQLLLAADKKKDAEVRRWAARFNTWSSSDSGQDASS